MANINSETRIYSKSKGYATAPQNASEEAPKKSVYDIITERFTEQLKKGVIPWEKPWISINGEYVGAWGHGENAKSYSLLNQMMLPKEGEYITFNQIKKENGKLKKGSKGYQIFYYDSFKTTQRNPNTNVDEEVYVPFLKYYTVFHIDDTEGITQSHKPDTSVLEGRKSPQRSRKADKLIKNYLKSSGVKYEEAAQNRACYKIIEDKVLLPDAKQFKKKAEYYSTVFHELVHSTGHESRLDRFRKGNAFSGKNYSQEELVAEVGASAILYHLGLETKSSVQNSHAYLAGWLNALENDHQMIVRASSKASKAVKMIYGEE